MRPNTTAKASDVPTSDLVDDGLGDDHFDLTLDYLRSALADAEVPDDCIGEVVAVFESTRRDILCRD